MMSHFSFIRENESITLNEGKVSIDLLLQSKVKDGVELLSIPSLNIHFYAQDKTSRQKIKEKAMTSVHSFFQYWLGKKGNSGFLKQMNFLGFEKTPVTKKTHSVKESQAQYGKSQFNLNEEFDLDL